MNQNEQGDRYINHPGHVIRGARYIAAYMGVSPATITRWRKRFRGRTEARLCFPAFNKPTGIGRGFQMVTHTSLILDWMQRWSEIDAEMLRRKPVSHRRRKTKRLGETEKPSMAEEKPQSLHERPPTGWPHPSPAPKKCTCGTPEPCTAHD